MSQQNNRLQEFIHGVRAEIPILFGVFPFGLIYGVFAVQAGLIPFSAQAMSSIIFAGSAQFAVAVLLSQNTPALVVILTAIVLNLRHAFYSASIAPHTSHLSKWWKLLLSYFLTDEAFAVAITRYQGNKNEPTDHDYRHWFFLGAGITLWGIWQLSTAIGILLGLEVPKDWSLDFTLSLTFIGIVVPALKDRASTLAAVSGGVTAVLLVGLPYKLGLMVSGLVGILVGMIMEAKS